MNRGDLVPDDLSLRIVEERFAENGLVDQGFVLDGFPRTLPQAEKLEDVLDGHPLDLVINLDVPTEIVLDRLAGRRVCEKCGTTYHDSAPPKSDWTCDVCSGGGVEPAPDTRGAGIRPLPRHEGEAAPLLCLSPEA